MPLNAAQPINLQIFKFACAEAPPLFFLIPRFKRYFVFHARSLFFSKQRFKHKIVSHALILEYQKSRVKASSL